MELKRCLGVLAVVSAAVVFAACGDEEGAIGDEVGGPCATDADCSGSTPRCDAGECVACLTGADCSDAAPVCTDGACGKCASSDDCEGREGVPHCDTEAGGCVACLEDAHCEGGACSDDGRCVECTEDADCESGWTCENEVCEEPPGCRDDGDCGEDERCYKARPADTLGKCEEICDPRYGEECTGEDRCDLLGFDELLAPQGLCRAPAGGVPEGGDCRLSECDTGLLCVNFGDGQSRCASMCDDLDIDSCGEDYSCVPVRFSNPAGAQIGVCAEKLPPCVRDSDCEEGETCTVRISAQGDALETVCAPAVGTKRAGESCVQDGECASNFCLEGQQVCYGACEVAEDCVDGATCIEITFSFGDPAVHTDTVPICVRACTDDGSCDEGQSCSYSVTYAGDEATGVCNAGGTGTKTAGESCTSSTECRSGRCDWQRKICMGACDGEEDCADGTTCAGRTMLIDAGPDGRWYTADDVTDVVTECRGLDCLSDADCGGWVCKPLDDPMDPEGEAMTLQCSPRTGAQAGGTACTSASSCASGICYDRNAKPEDCGDGEDNDGDGDVDCDDFDCHDACFREYDCYDGIDDDGDGATDCADGDCKGTCGSEVSCTNGIDDDGNGATDCEDPDCSFSCGEFFDCFDGVDNDADGLVDCRDPDCEFWSACFELECEDGVDDDGDGFRDCQDPDCAGDVACSAEGADFCDDGLDNDGDALTDCADPDCFDVGSCPETVCDDGLDDDGDGLVDCADPQCKGTPACIESVCDDGLDDDGDKMIDCHDPDCADTPACRETRCAGGDCCGDGLDNDQDGAIDCVDNDCFYDAACREDLCVDGSCCTDGLDNDGDGQADCADYDCRSNASCRETVCNDGLDDDGDGETDCDDRDCFSMSHCREQVCYQACDGDDTCPEGYACSANEYGYQIDWDRDEYAYLSSCVAAPAP